MVGHSRTRALETLSTGHAMAVGVSFTMLFCWLYARPFLELSYLAEADNFDFYLPNFLAPLTLWSSHEFAGTPEFANPQTASFYPLHLLFARVVGGAVGWTAFIASAAILAASFTYAYVFAHTGSRLAATVAGLTYGLSEAIIERIAHPTILHGAAWIPLVLLAVDQVREAPRGRWIVTGAFGVGCLILSGHPQMAVYGLYLAGLYAAAIAVFDRPPLGFYAGGFSLAMLGALLAAVSVLPLLEATTQIARQDVTFGAFAARANTPWQMLSILFPAIDHEGRDAPTYVGLAALLLSAVAIAGVRRRWRTAFWTVVVVICFTLGAGDATPLAGYAYDVPLYAGFRVVSRHLILGAFGLAALAGFGLALIQNREISRRAQGAALVFTVAAGAVAAFWILRTPSPVAWRDAEFWIPVASAGVWQQALILAAGATALIVFARQPTSRPFAAAIVLVVTVDLLQALPYGIDALGLVDSLRVSETVVHPSIHARRLKADLGMQRLLMPDGTGDGVVTGAFARLWKMQAAGGNSTMMLARHGELATMASNGGIARLSLQDDNVALDALAVRFIVVESSTLRADGDGPLNLLVGPRECGQRYPRSASFHMPEVIRVSQVTLLAHLGCSEDVPDGSVAATVRITAGGETKLERQLRAGIDIAEESLGNARRAAQARHRVPADAVERGDGRLSYELRLPLPEPVEGAAITIDVTGTAGWMELHGLSVTDDRGGQMSLGDRGVMVSSPRWKVVGTFSTSRYSDREKDEEAPEEKSYTVLENLRAQPRAWLAREVVALTREQMRLALHHAYLPDGRRFDPGRTALVETGTLPGKDYGPEQGRVVVRRLEDGAIDVAVSAPNGGMVVLSEASYPGWRALIDDRPAPLHIVDISLQGVVIPPGEHVVRFEFVSVTMRLGAGLSLLALVALLWLASRRSTPAAPAGSIRPGS